MIEKSLKLASSREWDVAIVGAGTVGLLAAKILVDRGVSVICLESGGFSFNEKSQELNSSTLIGERHFGVHEARGRVIGGTSTLWGGQLARFTKADFEARPEINRPAWPLNYDDLEPWYQVVADLLNLRSYDENYYNTLSTLFGESPPSTDSIEFYVTHWLKTPNVFSYLKKDLISCKKFALCPEAHVVQIKVSESGEVVQGLLAYDSEGVLHNIKSQKTILCNGTLEISRLLLCSMSHDNHPVWGGNKFIGAYFQDHLDINCGAIEIYDSKRFFHYFENGIVFGNKVQPKIRLTGNSILANSVLNIGGSMCFESSFSDDIQYLKSVIRSLINFKIDGGFYNLPRHLKGLVKIWWPLAWRYLKDRRIMAFIDKGVYLRAHMEQLPLLESAITLNSNKLDRFGVPELILDWRVDWLLQAKTLKDFSVNVDKFLRINNLGALKVDDNIINEKVEFIRNNCRDAFHQCGGTIMSLDQYSGVVDENCKVHGTTNLYIGGASVFPSSSYANPTFTAMALVARTLSGGRF